MNKHGKVIAHGSFLMTPFAVSVLIVAVSNLFPEIPTSIAMILGFFLGILQALQLAVWAAYMRPPAQRGSNSGQPIAVPVQIRLATDEDRAAPVLIDALGKRRRV